MNREVYFAEDEMISRPQKNVVISPVEQRTADIWEKKPLPTKGEVIAIQQLRDLNNGTKI